MQCVGKFIRIRLISKGFLLLVCFNFYILYFLHISAELKRRIGQLQKAQTGFESKSSTSTKTRTTTSQKIHQTSGEKLEASRSIRETISVENGVRTISRETIVDGLVVAIETETIDEETLQHGIPVKITTGKEQPPQLPVKIKDTQEEKEPKDEL